MTTKADLKAERLDFADDGVIPNNPRLGVRIYREVTDAADRAASFESLFAENGWTNSWRNGLYDFHHFHSNAHEVLGVAAGFVETTLGGEQGRTLRLEAGDAVVLPAGTGHKCETASEDILIVGAYAEGRGWDLRRGAPNEKEEVRRNIASVPDPLRDPVTGSPFDR